VSINVSTAAETSTVPETASFLAPPPEGPLEPGPVPTFSVIIAAYQTADTVGAAVASALAQTVPPHEVIVCDDGSSDDIEGALEPYRDRIVFMREEHRGESATKNTAVQAASGDFVSILDSDDRYAPERNELVGQLASARPDLDIITTGCYIEVDGEVVRDGEDNWPFVIADQRRALLKSDFIFPAVAVRRSRLIDVGGFDEAIVGATDWDCWLRLVFTGSRVGQVDRPLAYYGLREDSLSSKKALMARAAVATLDKAARTLEMSPAERSVVERTLAARHRKLRVEEARDALREGAPDARRRSLAIAARRGYDLRTRAKAAVSALVPSVGRRLLRSRDRKRWIGAAGVPVSRDQ
jgi:GT2 family glycosyltransferase